jgi:hypothetical protein
MTYYFARCHTHKFTRRPVQDVDDQQRTPANRGRDHDLRPAYSITSSARPTSVLGTLRPSAFAVSRHPDRAPAP